MGANYFIVFISFSFCFFLFIQLSDPIDFFFHKSCLPLSIPADIKLFGTWCLLTAVVCTASYSYMSLPTVASLRLNMHSVSLVFLNTIFVTEPVWTSCIIRTPSEGLTWGHSVSSQSLSVITSFRFSRQLISLLGLQVL